MGISLLWNIVYLSLQNWELNPEPRHADRHPRTEVHPIQIGFISFQLCYTTDLSKDNGNSKMGDMGLVLLNSFLNQLALAFLVSRSSTEVEWRTKYQRFFRWFAQLYHMEAGHRFKAITSPVASLGWWKLANAIDLRVLRDKIYSINRKEATLDSLNFPLICLFYKMAIL